MAAITQEYNRLAESIRCKRKRWATFCYRQGWWSLTLGKEGAYTYPGTQCGYGIIVGRKGCDCLEGVKLKRFRIFIFIFIFLSIVCAQLVIAQDKGFYLNDIISADQVQKQSGLIPLENIYEFINYGETLEEKLFVNDDSKIFVKKTLSKRCINYW